MSGRRTKLLVAARATVVVLVFVALVATPATALAKKPDSPPGKPDKPGPPPATEPSSTANPVLDSLSAYAAPTGSQVTLYGSGFGDTKGRNYVTFAGENGNLVSWSDTEIAVLVPNRAVAGYVGVVVDGVYSNGIYFVPALPPVIDSLSAGTALPGEAITIAGQNFDATQGEGSVTFAGVTGAVVSWSDTEIVVTVPDGTPSGYVGVWQNTLCSNGKFFIPGGVPTIEGASATTTIVGRSVTITGRNFGAAPEDAESVTLAGLPAAATSWSDTSITFIVPGNGKTGYIGVWRYDRKLCSNGRFLMVGPRIDSLSSWYAEPGGTITINGEGFGDVPDRVTYAGTNAGIVSWSDTQIVATLPASGALRGYVGVWRGSACSNGVWFLMTLKPRIASVDATSAAPGQLVTISGANFDTQNGSSRVTLAGVGCQIVSWSNTQVVARMPDTPTSGYLGVWKYGVASNGWWLPAAPATP
ncbi:MAG: IPT/TIG domain-containing protein [Coriobacteriia bacterium]|nr:IPT/TIG domain-containing protein [Coriobacteriia bacterium]